MEIGKYYITPDCDPNFNMAFDEWLFKQIMRHDYSCKAILRLYSWNRPAITFGFNQDFEKAVNSKLFDENIPIIRRATGGRAIYHDPDELTFTLIFDLNILPEKMRQLRQTNRLISEAVVEMIDNVGLKADWARDSDDSFKEEKGGRNKSCFGSISRYEVLSGSSKIVGGAQRKILNYLIHQGSIKINGISACPAIGQAKKEPDYYLGDSRKSGSKLTISDFSAVFCDVFSRKLSIDFKSTEISSKEREDIDNFLVYFLEKVLNRREFI